VRFCAAALSISLALLVGIPRASGETTLEGLANRSLREVSHDLEVDWHPDHIEVKQTLSLVARGRGDAEALYTFDLPVHAALHGASATLADGTTTSFAVVGAQAAVKNGFENQDITERADIGLLRMVSTDLSSDNRGVKTYELRLFPVGPKRATTVVLEWDAPTYRFDGLQTARIPGRGAGGNLVAQNVRVTTRASFRNVFTPASPTTSGLDRVKKGQVLRFSAPASGDVVLQGEPEGSGRRIEAEIGLLPIGPDRGFAAVRFNLPEAGPAAAAHYSRVILAVDVSRSALSSRKAVSTVVDKLLGALGTGTEVELVLFDRSARRVLGALKFADREVRTVIERALATAGQENGSDLARALDQISKILDESRAPKGKTLIGIITDGMLSTRLEPDDALARIGARALRSAQVVNVVLVPEKAPLPDLSGGALAALTSRTRGRSILWRPSEVATSADKLLNLIEQDAPVENPELELGGANFVGADLPGEIQSGQGGVALGYYEGKLGKAQIGAVRNGKRVSFALKPMSKVRGEKFARMVLASTAVGTFPLPRNTPKTRSLHREAARAMIKSASLLGVVTQESAAVLVDRKDGFAADRVKMAAKWGPHLYRRVRPEPEIRNASFRPFRANIVGGGPSSMPTGVLSRDLVKRLIQQHVVPHARRCYNRLIRKSRDASGELTLHLEMARGEVHYAEIDDSSIGLDPLHDCILDAAYAIPVPTVRLGASAEQISVARYPLRFRFKEGEGASRKAVVESGPSGPARKRFDPDDPLSGLPEETGDENKGK
jgi:hypothetical protein